MMTCLKKQEKTTQDLKNQIKSFKNDLKLEKNNKSMLFKAVEDNQYKMDQILTGIGCKSFTDFVNLSKKGFEIVSKSKYKTVRSNNKIEVSKANFNSKIMEQELSSSSESQSKDDSHCKSVSIVPKNSQVESPLNKQRKSQMGRYETQISIAKKVQKNYETQNTQVSSSRISKIGMNKTRDKIEGAQRKSVMDIKINGQQAVVKANEEKTRDICLEMITLVRHKKSNNKGLHFLSQKQTLKTIITIYRALMKLEEKYLRSINFPLFVFRFFSKNLGKGDHTEKKFYQFLLSIKQYAREGCFRINLFSKFMTLQEFANYSEQEVFIYITGLKKLNQLSSIGFDIPSNDSDQRILIAHNRALEHFRMVFELNQVDPVRLKKMKDKLIKLKQPDPTNMNKVGGCVDVDCFLNLMIEMYLDVIATTKEYVKYAFASADLDGSNKVTINEYFILFKHLEPKYYNEADLFVMFSKLADTTEQGKQAMTIERFSEMCYSRGYFSLETQYKFVGVNPENAQEDITHLFDKLTQDWKDVKKKLVGFFNRNAHNSSEDNQYWLECINVIENQLEVRELTKYFQVLICYKMVQKEIEEMKGKRKAAQELQNRLDDGEETENEEDQESSVDGNDPIVDRLKVNKLEHRLEKHLNTLTPSRRYSRKSTLMGLDRKNSIRAISRKDSMKLMERKESIYSNVGSRRVSQFNLRRKSVNSAIQSIANSRSCNNDDDV